MGHHVEHPRRRLLFVDHAAIAGGAQLVLIEHVQALDQRQFEIHVACTDAVPEIITRFGDAGARTHVVPMPRLRGLALRRLAGAVRGILALRQLVRSQRIELVISNTTRASYLASIAAISTGVPLIWWIRDFMYPRALFRMLSRIPRRIVYVSRALKDFYGDADPVRGVVWHVASSLHRKLEAVTAEEVLRERSRYGLQPGDFVIGFMARLVEEKGAADIIEAVGRLARDFPQVRLLVVGTGNGQANDAEERLHRLVDERQLSGVVKFAGFQWDEALYYRLFDMFVIATRDYEGYPTSVVQAMMAGKPVIGSAVGGTPEIITHLDTGLLYEPGNVSALESSVRLLLSDEGLRVKVAKAGQENVLARNQQHQLAAIAERLYVEVMGERS